MRRLLIAALLAAACLSACGGDGEPAAAEPSEEREFERARQEFAACMREHGVDFPDDGPVKIDGSQAEVREAEEACAHLRENIEPPELSDEQKQEFKEAALEHARCMREHGIDFPDPTFSDDGGAQVRIGPGSGIDPDDPDFREAQEACQDKLGAIMERRP